MMWHFYEIPYIPDLELVKYQSLGEQGIDGILERHNRFLRQWQRNTVLMAKAPCHCRTRIVRRRSCQLCYVVIMYPHSRNFESLSSCR